MWLARYQSYKKKKTNPTYICALKKLANLVKMSHGPKWLPLNIHIYLMFFSVYISYVFFCIMMDTYTNNFPFPLSPFSLKLDHSHICFSFFCWPLSLLFHLIYAIDLSKTYVRTNKINCDSFIHPLPSRTQIY